MKSNVAGPHAQYPAFDGGLDQLDALFQIRGKPAREDLDLCFLCLRWSSGDADCRNGVRCDMQQQLDRLEKPS
jgi:hypothetical protein